MDSSGARDDQSRARVVLITGTSSGLGAHMALHLARNGYQVFASMRDLGRGQSLLRALEREALSCDPLQLDVEDDASVAQALSWVLTKAGQIDVLINNAGVSCPGAIEHVDLADARRVFEINYFGAMRTIRAILPHMRARRSGMIINVSSLGGRYPLACAGHYSASKFALEGATECLALELAPLGIRVALVEPGTILTPIYSKHVPKDDPESPYHVHVRRAAALFAQRVRKRTLPKAVSETVQAILESKSQRLRHPVGEDAERLIAMRKHVTDEQMITTAALPSDDAYYDAMRAMVGVDLFR